MLRLRSSEDSSTTTRKEGQPTMARDHQRDTRNRGGRGHRPDRRISVRGVRREQPDLRKLAQALIALAQAQAEKDAEAEIKQRADQHPPQEAA